MTAESGGNSGVLPSLAQVRQQFLDAGLQLQRSGRQVERVSTGVDLRVYTSGPTVEFYLEADVRGGILCWWLEATQHVSQWLASASVLLNRHDREGQEQLRELPTAVASSEGELPKVLADLASALLASVDDLELFHAAAV